ncbi:MOSC domain-containing protein [Cryptosporangium arvum]|uniref:MOSC domain-containing protein n=1 Tax=Cryptosporangium arvum TaxID=80871 RepID=UPI000563FE35|nr:MOSC domain-containing protein [Cryptosporangium arvum]
MSVVISVSKDSEHHFSKRPVDEIVLLAGLGVEGDAHAGVTVQHRSRVAVDPTQPNLRQVHLIQSELIDELADFDLAPGGLGENVLTRGIDLLALPTGAVLRLGADATIEITGLRNPCRQIDGYRSGLLKQVLTKDERGSIVRRAGVMGVVTAGGVVRPGDAVAVTMPPPPHQALERV